MLRPATPLTLLLLAAFVLLLLSVLSVPIVKQIPLAQFRGVDFGVFGYCKGDDCSGFQVGYNPTDAVEGNQDSDFNLPVGTRATLTKILIIHPIAALFTLIMLVLAGLSHMHSPSHSPRYLLGVFILSILTLVLSLLSFLIDVLLFVPHMSWGSYIVLAATVLIAASGIVSCAMRRTLVSRKARKKRIAENAEMNGENYYARQAAVPAPIVPVPPTSTFSGGAGHGDTLPAFATFEESKETTVPVNTGTGDDERFPLTARTRSPGSERSPEGMNAVLAQPGQAGGLNRYGSQQSLGSQGQGRPPGRDQYGNIIPPRSPEMGVAAMAGGALNRYGSNQSLTSQGSRGFGPDGRREPRRDQYGNIIPPPPGGYGSGPRGGDPRNGGYGPGPGGYSRGRGGPGGPGGFRGRGGGPGYGRGGGYGPNGPYGQSGGPGGRGPGGRGPPPGYTGGGAAGYGRGGYSNRAPSPGDFGGYAPDQSQSTIQTAPYDAPGPRMRGGPGPGRGGYSNRAPSPMDYAGVGMGMGYEQSASTVSGQGAYEMQPTRSGSAPPPLMGDDYSATYAYSNINGAGGRGPMGGQARPESVARAESPPPMDDMALPPSLAVGGGGGGQQQGGLAPGQAYGGPVGQAVEMDATTGSRSPSHAPEGYGQRYNQI